MPTDLDDALAALRPLLLDLDGLVRAVAAGRRRGQQSPPHRRVELRPVDLKAGRHLQLVATPEQGPPLTRNLIGVPAQAAVEALLAEPFGTWYVETLDQVRQVRVTKKGQAQVHVARTSGRQIEARPEALPGPREHDRVKHRLLDPADPLFTALGADADKRRQVDAFLRLLAPVADRALACAAEQARPLRVVDLGCGNAYLTFAAHRFLSQRARAAGVPGVASVGVELRADLVARNAALAERLAMTGLTFVEGRIGDPDPGLGTLDVVLALHACDTATDDALAAAVRAQVPVVLAAPCCHHDVQRQLARNAAAGRRPPRPYAALTRYPILRERFADVLTDALRAALLRLLGYRVEVVEFVDSRHTPRNALIRAVRTAAIPGPDRWAEYRDLAGCWGVEPYLATLLSRELADRHPPRSEEPRWSDRTADAGPVPAQQRSDCSPASP